MAFDFRYFFGLPGPGLPGSPGMVETLLLLDELVVTPRSRVAQAYSPDAAWDHGEYLAAGMVDYLAAIAYSLGGRGAKPKPVKRPADWKPVKQPVEGMEIDDLKRVLSAPRRSVKEGGE